MTPKLHEFVDNLLEGTKVGTFKWKETPEQGVYRLFLDRGLVRIYKHLGAAFVGCTVLNGDGNIIHDVQVPREEGDSLAELYDLVDASFQETALDDLLAEVRMKMQETSRRATAGQS